MNDLISRQAAINAADRADYAGLTVEEVKKVTDEVVKELKQLPSVHPEKRTQELTGTHSYDLIGGFGIWQITVNGFCCSYCGYTLQVSGFPEICPRCHVHMLNVKTREKRNDVGICSYEQAKNCSLINKQSTTDVVKVVRCNQCKYYDGVHGVMGHAPCSFWKSGGVLWDDYCSNGEKIKDNE